MVLNKFLFLGQEALNRGDYQEALNLFKEAINHQGFKKEGWLGVAEA
jgi:cytochrome c-type biogenesis protein CcmH/NrfG